MLGIDIKERLTLVVGDIAVLAFSLYLTILFRNFNSPSLDLFGIHLYSFFFPFIVWMVIFFISGLYDKMTSITSARLPERIITSQVVNGVITVIFFYFIAPYLGISPKTNLLIFYVLSTILLLLWRLSIQPKFYGRRKESVMIVGSGLEMREAVKEVNENNRYPFVFSTILDIEGINTDEIFKKITDNLKNKEHAFIVIDTSSEKVSKILPHLFEYMFYKVNFIDFSKFYEAIFDRVPLSAMNHLWLAHNLSFIKKPYYDSIKRVMDIILCFIVGLPSVIFYPFVFLAIKLDDGGPILIWQKRVGKGGKKIYIPKFRSMKNKESDAGKWVVTGDERITRVGKFLRKSRIDELPQILSVLKGDISFIGPRPDMDKLNDELAVSIPYYSVRYSIKPGLSGWAQINQELPPQSLEDTKIRLAYDFFYIKNRSFWLDVSIALKTIKTLASRSGV